MKYFFTTKVKVVLVVALLLSAGLAVLSGLTGMNPGDLLVKGELFTSGGQSIWNFIFSISSSNEYSWVELL